MSRLLAFLRSSQANLLWPFFWQKVQKAGADFQVTKTLSPLITTDRGREEVNSVGFDKSVVSKVTDHLSEQMEVPSQSLGLITTTFP